MILKGDLNAEGAEVFAEVAEKDVAPRFLCEYLGILCVLRMYGAKTPIDISDVQD